MNACYGNGYIYIFLPNCQRDALAFDMKAEKNIHGLTLVIPPAHTIIDMGNQHASPPPTPIYEEPFPPFPGNRTVFCENGEAPSPPSPGNVEITTHSSEHGEDNIHSLKLRDEELASPPSLPGHDEYLSRNFFAEVEEDRIDNFRKETESATDKDDDITGIRPMGCLGLSKPNQPPRSDVRRASHYIDNPNKKNEINDIVSGPTSKREALASIQHKLKNLHITILEIQNELIALRDL